MRMDMFSMICSCWMSLVLRVIRLAVEKESNSDGEKDSTRA